MDLNLNWEKWKIFLLILAIFVEIALIFGLVVGYVETRLESYSQKDLEKRQEIKRDISKNNEELVLIKNKLNSLNIDIGQLSGETKETTSEIRQNLNTEIANLQEKLEQEKQKRISSEEKIEEYKKQISNLQDAISGINNNYDVSSIINEWRPRIAHIKCELQIEGATGSITGSGRLTRDENENIYVLTNQHVVQAQGITADFCYVDFPEYKNTLKISSYNIAFVQGYDLVKLNIYSPPEEIKQFSSYSLNICKSAPEVGEAMVILGYPQIGANTGITATEGILAGIEKEYFITSAKVEQGNSGGAAILLDDNCYLGVPTFVRSGILETLARILKAEIIF